MLSLFDDDPRDVPLPLEADPAVFRSSSFSASSTPAVVRQAVLDWANDLGWIHRPPFLVFAMDRLMIAAVELTVALDDDDGWTIARFTALLPIWKYGEGSPTAAGWALERVAETFAAGVATQLRKQGVKIGPGGPAGSQDRERLRLVERWRWPVCWALVAAGIAAFVAILPARGLSHYGGVVFGILLWISTVFLANTYLRWRILGVRLGWLFFFVLLCALGTVGLLIAAIYGDL
jgi:hypothetical protein